MTLEPGVIINHRYRILSILGQGGMGSVYRAMDQNLSVEVALKENLYLTEEYTRQFKREAAILATLRHPNLPKVTDHFEIPGQGQYLVMEFITGEDLRERMDRENILNETEVVHIGASICDALTYLHTRSPAVLHRDIKPGNIRITDEGHVLLVDFGLAKLQLGTQETTSGARAMTPGYSPPEQYGTSRTDARSDIYALGATLYAALGGAAPEDSLSRITDFTNLTSIRSLNPKVSKKMTSVLEKALELRAEDRYQSADDMKIALLSVLGEKPVSRPITITPPPSQSYPKLRSDPLPLQPSSQSRRRLNKRESRNLVLIAFLTTLLIVGVIAATLFFLVRAGVILQPTKIPLVVENTTNTPDSSKPSVPSFTPDIHPTQTSTPPTDSATIPLPTIPSSGAVNPTATMAENPATPEATVISTIGAVDHANEIAFASMRNGFPQVWLMYGDGSNQHQLTNLKEGACQPDWSPDGTRVVFISPCQNRDTRYEKSNLFIINSDGTNLTILDAGYGGNYDPSWSPDGTKIAFTKELTGFTQIYVMDLTTGGISALIDEELPSKQPVWSPDGKQVAFILTKYNTDHIWILDLATKDKWQLTRSKNQNDTNPVWSPDGLTIYFTQSSISEFNPDMVSVPYDTAGKSQEYPFPMENHPVPSPAGDGDISADGQWMVFESWPEGSNHDIYKMSMSGDIVIRLTDVSKVDFQPAWK